MDQIGQTKLERSRKQRTKAAARRRFLYAALITVLVLTAAALLIENFFVVRELRVVSTSPFYTADQVRAATGLEIGQNMFSFSEKEIRSDMLRKLSYFSDVRLKKIFPSILEISFEEIPGTLYMEVAGATYILGPDFYVIAKALPVELEITPRAYLITRRVMRCVVGEPIVFEDDTQLETLEQVYRVLERYGEAENMTFIDIQNKFKITLCYADRWDIQLGDAMDMEYKTRMLLQVLKEYTAEDGGTIDLSEVTRAIVKQNQNLGS